MMPMKFWLLLLLAIISTSARAEGNAKGHILTSSRKTTYFPPSSKGSFSTFQTFGGTFSSPASDYPLSGQGGSFTHSSGGRDNNYSGENYSTQSSSTGSSSFSQRNENFPRGPNSFSQEAIPPVGENFLRISQNTRTSFTTQSSQSGAGTISGASATVSAQVPPSVQTSSILAPTLPASVSLLPAAVPVLPVVPPAPPAPAPIGRQGVSATGPFSFGTPTSNLEDILEQEWNSFKIAFNKTYSTFEEERQRREIFIENRNKVARFNQEYGNGRHSFVQKLNQYADLLNHEFNRLVNGLNRTRNNGTPPPERKSSSFIPSANVNLPSYVDWREAGAVTSVRRQGNCGACYAFAAAGSLEGQNYRKTGRLVELSPQNLIDCTESYSNSGCVGGLMEYAFEYVRDNRGIDTEGAYPFEERDGQQCRYRREGYGAHDTGYVVLDEGDEQALMTAVATIGPVAAGIDAHPDAFQFYSNGVYFETSCSSSTDQLNHAVLVVGYGTEPNGQQYWLIKNSYGPEWGVGGYMKLAKFSSNHCGIASYAVYPLV